MKTLNKVFATIAFYTLVIVVFMWTATLTLAEMREIMPNDPVTPFFALALFDGGAVVWLLVFTGKAKGLWQRGISALMLAADLIGVIAISMARLLTAGQEMVVISPELGAAVGYGVGIMTAINFLGIYGFHVTDPGTLAEIEAQSLEDELYQEAQEQARANMEGEKAQLAGVLAARATAGIKARLYLPISDRETLAMAGVIDGEIVEDDTKRTTKSAAGVPAWMIAAANLLRKKTLKPAAVATQEQDATLTNQPQPTETDRLTPTEQASAWANIPPELEERMAKYGDRHDKANAVFFDHDETPRYHPSFGLEGKRWETIDGERVMIGGLHKAFQEGVAIAEASPDTGESFQDIPESQNGGLDGGYIPQGTV